VRNGFESGHTSHNVNRKTVEKQSAYLKKSTAFARIAKKFISTARKAGRRIEMMHLLAYA